MAFFDSYKNIDRGGITKESKTTTADALFVACTNPKCRDHALQIVKALLDFKAHQSDDTSAERLLGNLANNIKVCNQAKGLGVSELTERSLHELVRNRSALFKKDLPDTFKQLLKRLLLQNGPQVLVDTNTARILRSNGLITEAEARAATPARRVAEQILPGELAAFFNRSEKMWGEQSRMSSGWSLSTFLLICAKDLGRTGSDMEKKALAHLVVQASKGSLGTQKFHEVQRQAKEVRGTRDNFVNFANKMRGPLEPNRANEVSPYIGERTLLGGQERNFRDFYEVTKSHAKQYERMPGFKQAMDSFEGRLASLAKGPRMSQHLAADYARKSTQYQIRPTIMTNEGRPPESSALHQQFLDLREVVVAGTKQQRLVDAEEVKAIRALLVCAAATQTVIGMLYNNRKQQGDGGYELNGDETRLRDRVVACLAQQPEERETPEQRAIDILCKGGGSEIRGATTHVEIQSRIVHQEMVREIRIPGCQPFERFYLFQERKIQFSWDEKVNFIQGKIIYHSPWMCSTTEHIPIEENFDKPSS